LKGPFKATAQFCLFSFNITCNQMGSITKKILPVSLATVILNALFLILCLDTSLKLCTLQTETGYIVELSSTITRIINLHRNVVELKRRNIAEPSQAQLAESATNYADDIFRQLPASVQNMTLSNSDKQHFSASIDLFEKLAFAVRNGWESQLKLQQLTELGIKLQTALAEPLAEHNAHCAAVAGRLRFLLIIWFAIIIISILTIYLTWYRERLNQHRLLLELINQNSGEMTDETAALLTREQHTLSPESQLKMFFSHFQKDSHSKDTFFASMSHEIRTPLNGLIGFLSNLGSTRLNDQQQQYFRIIQSSAQSLLHVINQILDFSKIKAGQMTLEEIPFDLKSLLEERFTIAKQNAKQKGLKAHLDIPDGELVVRTDPAKLRQVIDNLISNAIKFTERGEIVLDVKLLNTPDNAQAELSFAVRDSGIGISLDQQKNLFNSYAQANSSVARCYGGTGLGLAISASLVSMLGGKLELKSRPGEGSCFFFTLKLARAKAAEQVHISELYAITLPPAALKKRWALLVDDTPTNLFLLETICQSIGLPYRTAENGRAALELFSRQQFDLVFMDIQMPIMDGYTAISEMRKLPGNEKTRIIALTASAFQEDIDKAYAVGANGFIPKPFERDQLLLCIADALDIIPDKQPRGTEEYNELPEAAIVRQMHDFMREQYQVSLGEIKMILAQTVADWRPLLDNLLTYAGKNNADEALAILQRLKGQLAAIGLLDFSEQTVPMMQEYRNGDPEKAREQTVVFVQSLTRIFKALETEVTVS